MNASKLKNRVTVTRPTFTENDFGDHEITGTETIGTFWAHVEEMKSTTSESPLEVDRKFLTRNIKVIARASSVDGVDVDDELTFPRSDRTWQVQRVYLDPNAFRASTTTFGVIEASEID